MYIFKLLKPNFIFSFMFLGFIASLLLKFEVVEFGQFLEYKELVFSFVSIYFLININRIVNFSYLRLISYSSTFMVYSRTVGLFFFAIPNLVLIKYFDLFLFLRESVLMLSLIFLAAYLQERNEKIWVKYLILNLLYLLVTSILWT